MIRDNHYQIFKSPNHQIKLSLFCVKKLLLSIAVCSYLIVSTGIVVNFHYCMNRLASTQLYGAKAKICGKCGMDIHLGKGCCRDEVKVVKLQTDHNKAQVTHEMAMPAVPVAVLSSFITIDFVNNDRNCHFLNHSPPLLTEQDTYLQNCVFRI